MLKGACINPEIMSVLTACGHGDKVLIADGNYPLDSNTHDNTKLIYLNLTHGMPKVTDVLKVINETIAVEKFEVMMPEGEKEPEIFSEFRDILGKDISMGSLGRFEFYDECREPNIKMAIATGEQRTFANILLTVGVV